MFQPETCRNGHERTEWNTYRTPAGQRRCKICVALFQEEHRNKPRALAIATPEPEHRSEVAGHAVSYRCMIAEPEKPMPPLVLRGPWSPPVLRSK